MADAEGNSPAKEAAPEQLAPAAAVVAKVYDMSTYKGVVFEVGDRVNTIQRGLGTVKFFGVIKVGCHCGLESASAL
jgi:hypothetical protein